MPNNSAKTNVINTSMEDNQIVDDSSMVRVFDNPDFGNIEIIIINDKEYFPAVECAKILGYVNPHDAISKHCRVDGVAFCEVVSETVNQYGTATSQKVKKKYINEGNLYRLIVRSKLPEAIKFEKWVFDEVLPSIRKTGAYIAIGSDTEQYISNLQNTVTELSLQLVEIHKALRILSGKKPIDMKIVNIWKKQIANYRMEIISEYSGIDIKDCYKMVYDIMADDYGFCESAVINDFVQKYECDKVSTITIIAADKLYRQWFVQAADKLIECVSPVVPQITSCDSDKALGEINPANEVQPLKNDIQEDHIQSEHFRKLSVNDEYEEIIDYIAALRGDRSKTKLSTKKYIFPLMSSPKGWKIALSRNRCATKKALIKTNIKYKKKFVKVCNEIVNHCKYNKKDFET